MESNETRTRKETMMNATSTEITVKGKTFLVEVTDDQLAGNGFGMRIWELKNGQRHIRNHQKCETEAAALAMHSETVAKIKAL